MNEPIEIHLEPHQAGIRLDLLLGQRLEMGRAPVKKLLESGRVRLNGRRVGLSHKGEKLSPGATIQIDPFERPGEETLPPQPDLPLNILTEGPGWVVVDKPAGVSVHPLEAGEQGTLLNAVVARYPQIQGVGEKGLRSGVVHRLDLETSGALLFATEERAWQRLREAFSERATRKVYRAIVEGKLTGEKREVMELVVAQHRPARVKAIPEKTKDSRRCDLHWKAVEPLSGATLLEIELGTGFLHQIRAMMAALGHPIVGDRIYGAAMMDVAPRQMLHASRIEVPLMSVKARSREPDDFLATLRQLR